MVTLVSISVIFRSTGLLFYISVSHNIDFPIRKSNLPTKITQQLPFYEIKHYCFGKNDIQYNKNDRRFYDKKQKFPSRWHQELEVFILLEGCI